jgi:hypothetical protein
MSEFVRFPFGLAVAVSVLVAVGDGRERSGLHRAISPVIVLGRKWLIFWRAVVKYFHNLDPPSNLCTAVYSIPAHFDSQKRLSPASSPMISWMFCRYFSFEIWPWPFV